MTEQSALVSTDWLADHLADSDLRVLDATWFLPTQGRDGRAEFQERHLPGALRFDIEEIADRASPLPHTLPEPEAFGAAVGRLGIGDDTLVVIYDDNNYIAGARAWWMFRVMGHARVAVLDGGLRKWTAEGRPVTAEVVEPSPATFTARFDQAQLRDFARMQANLASGAEQVADARAAARFTGEAPEPRPGLPSGHIPGSRSLPSATLVAADGTLEGKDALLALFAEAGIAMDAPLVASCGSGVSACVIALAAHEVGKDDVAIYDGSWTEWAAKPDAPIATGPAEP